MLAMLCFIFTDERMIILDFGCIDYRNAVSSYITPIVSAVALEQTPHLQLKVPQDWYWLMVSTCPILFNQANCKGVDIHSFLWSHTSVNLQCHGMNNLPTGNMAQIVQNQTVVFSVRMNHAIGCFSESWFICMTYMYYMTYGMTFIWLQSTLSWKLLV